MSEPVSAPVSDTSAEPSKDPVDWAQRRRRLFALIFGTIVSGFVGELYGRYFYPTFDDDPWRGFRTGAMIGLVSIAIEIYYIRSQRNTWIRRVAFLPGLLVRILVLTILVRALLISNELISDWIRGIPLAVAPEPMEELRDTLFSMGVVIVFVVISQLASLIGIKRFINLVVGRYFRPSQEDRQFLFIDLVGSSQLARKLGDINFHEFLADFFHLIDRPIASAGGEIVSYVGDAAIVTWPLTDKGKRNARSLQALQQIDIIVRNRSAAFEERYGHPPRFRAALHGGPVVVGECGNMRRQVTFLGDVVNMTARMDEWAKGAGEARVISTSLLASMELPDGVTGEPLGEHILRDSNEALALSRLKFS
ncbi:MAG: adenylate/guanylate cyclase domain-containing protein [Pseudomonadota bacterium]